MWMPTKHLTNTWLGIWSLCTICACERDNFVPLKHDPYLAVRFLHLTEQKKEEKLLAKDNQQLAALLKSTNNLSKEIDKQTTELKTLENRIAQGEEELKPQRNMLLLSRDKLLAQQNEQINQTTQLRYNASKRQRYIQNIKSGRFALQKLNTNGQTLSFQDSAALYLAPLSMTHRSASLSFESQEGKFDLQLTYENEEILDQKDASTCAPCSNTCCRTASTPCAGNANVKIPATTTKVYWKFFSKTRAQRLGWVLALSLSAAPQIKAQQADTLSLSNAPWLSTLGLQADYGRLLSLAYDRQTLLCFAINTEWKRKYGMDWTLGHETFYTSRPYYENVDYLASGSYAIAHLSRIFSFGKTYSLSIGAGYGYSSYQEQGTIHIESASGLHQNYLRTFKRNRLSARWTELKLNSYKRMWFKGFRMGFALRGRFLMSKSNVPFPQTYRIPGLGIAVNQSYPTLNLWARYDLFSY